MGEENKERRQDKKVRFETEIRMSNSAILGSKRCQSVTTVILGWLESDDRRISFLFTIWPAAALRGSRIYIEKKYQMFKLGSSFRRSAATNPKFPVPGEEAKKLSDLTA